PTDFLSGISLGGDLTVEGNLEVGGTIQGVDMLSGILGGLGISVDQGNLPTVTNTDRGSAQAIFKKFSVSGQSDIVAVSNSDVLTFVAGDNITLTSDATNKKLTIKGNAVSPDYS